MCMTKQIKLKNQKMNLTMSCNNMGIESILYNFWHMNHDKCGSSIAGMQDPHPNLNVNRGIPIRIESE